MNPILKTQDHPYKEQDSKVRVLLLFLFFFPLTALAAHSHLAAALWVLGMLGVAFGLWSPENPLFQPRKVKLYCLFLCFSLSGIVMPLARGATLLSSFLRLSFFLPLMLGKKQSVFSIALSFIGGLLGLGALAELFLGYGQTGYNDEALFPTLKRAAFLFDNPNVLAAFLLPSALFALDIALVQTKCRLLFWLSFFFAAGGILATFSRGGMLAFAVGCVWLLLQRYGWERLLTAGLLLFPLSLLLIPSELSARLSSFLTGDSSVSYRLSLWKSIFHLDPRTLLFGVGEGKETMLSLLFPHLAAGLSHIEHTHSLFLHFLISGGVIGLFLFLCLVVHPFLKRKNTGACAALLALLVFGIFDDPLYSGQTEVIFWLTLGLC